MSKCLIIFLLILLFVLSGCIIKPGQSGFLNEKNAQGVNSYDENAIKQRMDMIKNGLTANLKPDKKSSAQAVAGESQQDASAENRIQLEDLSSQFNAAIIKTNYGEIKVKFYSQESPLTVNNFMNLAKKEFYNGTKFHRVIKDFMIQGGDPLSKDADPSNDGQGGPGYQFQDEINSHQLVRGSLAMANSGANTNGSQFFIVTADSTPELNGKHTNFGYVAEGMATVDKIQDLKTDETDHPLEEVIIKSIELLIDNTESPMPPAIPAADQEVASGTDSQATTTHE